MTLKAEPVARAEMLIRRPVAEVFEAFVDGWIQSHTRGLQGLARAWC